MEKDCLGIIEEVLEEAAVRPIWVKRDNAGLIKVVVSDKLTFTINCLKYPKIEVCEYGDNGVNNVYRVNISAKEEKRNSGLTKKEIAVFVWGHFPITRKIILLQQRPSGRLEISLRRIPPCMVGLKVTQFKGFLNIGNHESWWTDSNPHLVALGRAFILGDCPESVFIEGLCEASNWIKEFVYIQEPD